MNRAFTYGMQFGYTDSGGILEQIRIVGFLSFTWFPPFVGYMNVPSHIFSNFPHGKQDGPYL